MPTLEETAAFAERLRFVMKRAPEKLRGATDLANQFNLRHRSGQPVSPQTAHKWLSGRTIPTQDKLETLAAWFGIEVHWLHYGPSPGNAASAVPKPRKPDEKYPLSEETLELASKIEALSAHHRYLVEELVSQFYGTEKI
jgi:transcriptional regulator with XRE-family HTH domain